MRGDGRIYQRGTIWWVQYAHRGTCVRESSKSTDRRVAQRLLQERRRTAGTAQFIAPKMEQLSFSVLTDIYLADQRANRRRSLDHAERYVRNLLAAFGGDRALDVTGDRIEAYRDQRRADGLAPASVNRELAALRRMFKLGVRKGKLPAAPHIELLDESENVRENFLEPPEFEAVCGVLPAYLQDPARFAYLTCWRIGAIRALEWYDVNLRARTLRLRAAHAKNKRPKLLPLAGALLELFERRAAARDLACPFVFPGAGGGRLGDFRKAWKRACVAAGVHGTVFHDLRRSGARNGVRSGSTEQVVMELGGWRSRAVFERYNITSERDLADAIERVSGYVADRAADAPKIRPLHGEQAQSGFRQSLTAGANAIK
jgi:integrase